MTRVSVVMAAFNGATLIGETLASLTAQTMPDFEVLVVDDCSTDSTREVVRACHDPRVRLIEAEVNGGPVRARNRAFAEAQGRYIAGLDQDDLCHPERFARQVSYLDTQPDVVLAATAANILCDGNIAPSRMPANTTAALIGWLLQVMNPLVWSSVMIRGETARQLNPFTRAEILYAEDFDLYHRLSPHGRIARIDRELLTYRVHAGGASQRYRDTMIDSTTRVLEGAYLPVLGDDAASAARLVAAHVIAETPVPDRATLHRLGALIATLQTHYLAEHRCDAESTKLIRWETARLWWRIGRRAVRSGALPLSDAVAVRPNHMGLGHANIDDLLVSGLVGAARRRRLAS